MKKWTFFIFMQSKKYPSCVKLSTRSELVFGLKLLVAILLGDSGAPIDCILTLTISNFFFGVDCNTFTVHEVWKSNKYHLLTPVLFDSWNATPFGLANLLNYIRTHGKSNCSWSFYALLSNLVVLAVLCYFFHFFVHLLFLPLHEKSCCAIRCAHTASVCIWIVYRIWVTMELGSLRNVHKHMEKSI